MDKVRLQYLMAFLQILLASTSNHPLIEPTAAAIAKEIDIIK